MVANYKTNECEYIEVLGTRIDNLSREEIENWIKNTLGNPPQQKFVATLNPEIILKGHREEGYKKILNSADLNICDGFGVKLVAALKGKKVESRYTGVELTDFLLKQAKEKNFSVFVAVAKNSLSKPKEIEQEIKEKYNLKIKAKYFEKENFFDADTARNAQVVLVNFGSPRQEKFIFENCQAFPEAKVLAGVGGAFDFLTGKMKRAPGFFQKIGVEWLWRLAQEPKRAKRIWNAVIVFPYLAVTRPD